MKRDYYITPRSSKLMRFFWRSAGADRYILDRATYSDQVKYMCLGGIIVATGLMAALAGGYAFYTIFEPRGSAIEQEFNIPTAIISVVFGCLWGLMIFNLDRFIVSSTGKGDGTEAITWDELKGAIPRIIMGAIIALTISKPVEIRMFKTEIDVALHKHQMEKQQEYLSEIEAIYAPRIEEEKEKLEKWEEEIQVKEAHYATLEQNYYDEMAGNNGGDKGVGPQAKALKAQMDRMDAEIEQVKNKNIPLIDQGYGTLRKFEAEKQKDISNGEVVASGLDGLLERIKLAHEIAGFWISLFITLLFMAIELTPIFFKLMLTKSPYDFLKENIEELMIAEEGIQIEYNYYKDKEGQQRDLVKHLGKDKLLLEKSALQKTQEELTEYAISKYKEEMKRRIDENPKAFIHVEENGQSV